MTRYRGRNKIHHDQMVSHQCTAFLCGYTKHTTLTCVEEVLDCSKAFDKIKHDVLFKKLYDKGLSTLTVRIIMNMYLHGSAQVRWHSTTSHSFNVINGVKQGSVISLLFFALYVDELIDKLEHSGF